MANRWLWGYGGALSYEITGLCLYVAQVFLDDLGRLCGARHCGVDQDVVGETQLLQSGTSQRRLLSTYNNQHSTVSTSRNGLSQQGVWVSFCTPKPLKSIPQVTPIFLLGISLNVNLKHIIEFFHLHIIPMTLYKDIMPYFDKFIRYG